MDEATTGAVAPPVAVRHRSPFEGHQPGDRPARDGQIGVRLSAGTIFSVTQVATWPSGTDALVRALGAALGLEVPARTGDVVHLHRAILVRSGPEEFMLLCEQQADRVTELRKTILADIGSVTDLSHARCHIRIEGDKCRDTLSKLFALDFREPAFPLDQIRLTGHHHVPSMLHRRERDDFDIYVFSTYAHDQLSTLVDAALEYGVSLAVSHADDTRK
ncbi:MAG: hypothetical protein H7274_25630 [Rhodoferax sp.]|nr:hypothetical protein [Rhodoferax sp.]